MARVLEGAGGDSGPVNTEDNLLSTDAIEVVLAISEGPIEGIVGVSADDRKRSTMVGDTPLVDAVGKTNFDDFVAAYYNGTPSDTPIEFLLGGAASNHTPSLPVSLTTATPVTRVWQPPTDPTVMTLVEIRLQVNQLYKSGEDGTKNNTVQFQLAYRPPGGGAWRNWDQNAPGAPSVQTMEITGKTTGGYVKEYATLLPGLAVGVYEFRVTKITGINTTEDFRDITWESFQTSTPGDASYPNVALLHIKGKASNQFNSVPDFSGIFEGWKMKVPSNYNPVLGTYTPGPWNGTFHPNPTYTNNPAWVLYNLIVDERLGLAGYYKNVAANRYAFYRAGQWCDELVPDGVGGTQRRFTFNELINQQRNGLELLQFIAGAFNSVLFDDGNGVVHLRTDQYSLPLQIFTPDNISEEGFSYSYSDISTRANSVTVSFVNPDLNWTDDRRIIEDAARIAENGRIPLDFIAVGCTNVHEATRRARYRLVTMNTEVASVTFVTNRLGMLTALFDSIYIADPDSSWSTPGRVKSIVGNVVNLRDPIFFTSTDPVTMKIQTARAVVPEGGGAAAGGFFITDVTVVPPGTGLQSSFTKTAGTFPSNMPDRVVFTLHGSTFGLPKPFKVMAIEETGEGGKTYQITALEINVNKYSDVEGGTTSVPVPYAYVAQEYPLAPINLQARSGAGETRVDPVTGIVESFIFLSWQRPPYAFTNSFDVIWQEKGTGVWKTEFTTSESITLGPVRVGATYNMQVVAVSPKLTRSEPSVLSNYLVEEGLAAPQAPLGTAVGGMFQVRVTWTFVGLATNLKSTEVWYAPSNNRAGAVRLEAVPYPAMAYTHEGLAPGVGGFYWLRTVNSDAKESPWFPLDPLAGMEAYASTDASLILDFIEDQIGVDQLTSNLRDRIALIDNPASDAASVNGRLAAMALDITNVLDGTYASEFHALRVQTEEISGALLQDIINGVADRDAFTGELALARWDLSVAIEEGISAEAAERLVLAAVVGTNAAALTQEVSTRTTQTSALAQDISTLSSVVDDNQAGLVESYYTKADIDGALAQTVVSLAAYSDTSSKVFAQPIPPTRRGINSALTPPVDVPLVAGDRWIDTDDSNQAYVWSGTAWVEASNTFAQATAPANAAVGDFWVDTDDQNRLYRWDGSTWVNMRDLNPSALITTLEQTKIGYSTRDGKLFDNGGLITNKTEMDAWNAANPGSDAVWNVGLPLATAIKQLHVTIGGQTASLEQTMTALATSTDTLEARHTLKLDVNGYVSGTESVNNGVTSSFTVLADKFLIARPDASGTPVALLVMGMVNGVNNLGLNGNMIIDGTLVVKTANITNLAVTTGKIANLAVDTLQIAGNAIGVSNFASGTNTAGTSVTVPPNVSARCLVVASSGQSNSSSNLNTAGLSIGGSFSGYTSMMNAQDLSSEFAGYLAPPMVAIACDTIASGAGGLTLTASASFDCASRSAGVTIALFVNWK